MAHLLGLDALRGTVQAAIDQGRLGEPRFLRCIAHADSAPALKDSLAELVALGEGWFGSPAAERHRVGDGGDVYVSEMLKWAGGQGAVLSVTAAPSLGFPSFDLMLIGSRGALYHEM